MKQRRPQTRQKKTHITPLTSPEDSRPSKRPAPTTATAQLQKGGSKRARAASPPRFSTQPASTSQRRPTPPPPFSTQQTRISQRRLIYPDRSNNQSQANPNTQSQSKQRPTPRRLCSNTAPEISNQQPDPLFTAMDLEKFDRSDDEHSDKFNNAKDDDYNDFAYNDDDNDDNDNAYADEDDDDAFVNNKDNSDGFANNKDRENNDSFANNHQKNNSSNQQSALPLAVRSTVNHPEVNRRVINQQATLGTNTSSSHMTGELLQSFNRLATRADLDEEHKTIGRELCNATDSQGQFLSSMVSILSACQEIALARNDILRAAEELKNLIPKSTSAWKGGTELKQCVKQIAYQCILSGDVQAYTAKEDKEGEQEELPHSLFAKVMTALLSAPSEWKNRVLPPGYGRDPEPGTPTALQSLINNALK